jgi:hypothetical protein
MGREIACRVLFDWDFNGTYTDESANLVRASGDARFAPPEAAITATQGIVDACSIELRNTAGRYSALNSSGALYTYLQSGGAYHVPVYVETSINGGSSWQRVFTGVTKIPRETGRTYDGIPSVRFECRGVEEKLLQARRSTTSADFLARVAAGYTESELIAAYLTDAGVAGGDQVLDRGMFVIPWAWLDDESILEDAWQIAAAAGGRLYTDANGDYRYENMAHWLNSPHRTSQQTYTNADWKNFEAWHEDGELFDTVTVEYAGRVADPATVLWTPDEVVTVPAAGTRKVLATYSQPAATAPELAYRAASAGGTDLTASVSASVMYYAQRAEITFTNAHATYAATIYPLTVTAQPAVGGPTADETRTAADDGTNSAYFTNRGGRTRSIRGNVYIQSRAQAGTLAQFLLDRHEKPRVFYRATGLLGNGARRPGDRVTLNDTSVMSSGRAAMVLAVDWNYGGMAYTMDLECMDAASLYTYADTSPGYFIIGGAGTGNQLGAAHANRGRIFY